MQFEIKEDDHTVGVARFEGEERKLVNEALFAVLVRAATLGKDQLDPRSPIYTLVRTLISPDYISLTGAVAAKAEHFEALAETVDAHTQAVAYDQAQKVGGFVGQLRVAARVLKQNAEMTTQTDRESEIDSIVSDIIIPDTPEGLTG